MKPINIKLTAWLLLVVLLLSLTLFFGDDANRISGYQVGAMSPAKVEESTDHPPEGYTSIAGTKLYQNSQGYIIKFDTQTKQWKYITNPALKSAYPPGKAGQPVSETSAAVAASTSAVPPTPATPTSALSPTISLSNGVIATKMELDIEKKTGYFADNDLNPVYRAPDGTVYNKDGMSVSNYFHSSSQGNNFILVENYQFTSDKKWVISKGFISYGTQPMQEISPEVLKAIEGTGITNTNLQFNNGVYSITDANNNIKSTFIIQQTTTTINSNFKNGQPYSIQTISSTNNPSQRTQIWDDIPTDLNKDGKIEKTETSRQIINDVTYTQTITQKTFTPRFGIKSDLTQYTLTTRKTITYKYNEQGKEIESTEIITDSLTGEPIGVRYTKEGVVQSAGTDEDGLQIVAQDPSTIQKLDKLKSQYKWRSTFNTIEYLTTEFQGLGYISNLFMSKDELAKWRNTVDQAFCDSIVLGSVECWTSKVCEHQYDKTKDSVSYVMLPGDVIKISAHVEGERSSPIEIPGEPTAYLYKLTFWVRAAEEDAHFNILLSGERTAQLFNSSIMLKGDDEGEGQQYSGTGTLAIVQYSPYRYDRICLKFSKGDIEDVCNKIVQSDYSKENILQAQGAGTLTGNQQPGTASPSLSYEESQKQRANQI